MIDIKTELYNYILANGSVSYAEIEHFFEENNYSYKGDILSASNVDPNVVFWHGWNTKAFNLLTELVRENKVSRDPTTPLIYFIDGKFYTFPIVKNPPEIGYKSPHWLPCVFSAVIK